MEDISTGELYFIIEMGKLFRKDDFYEDVRMEIRTYINYPDLPEIIEKDLNGAFTLMTYVRNLPEDSEELAAECSILNYKNKYPASYNYLAGTVANRLCLNKMMENVIEGTELGEVKEGQMLMMCDMLKFAHSIRTE